MLQGDQELTLVLDLIQGIDSYDLAWFRNSESRRDLIKRMKYIKVDPKLRSECVYNNLMYAVAGEAATNVSGMTYEELVRTKVIDPLGLTNTGLSVMEMKERGDNYAMPFDAASFEDGVKGKFVQGYLDDVYMADAAAGDIYSNTLDLVRWGRVIMQSGMQDGKQVLNKESVEETKTAYSIFENKTKRTPEFAPVSTYGLGWFIDSYKGQAVYRHSKKRRNERRRGVSITIDEQQSLMCTCDCCIFFRRVDSRLSISLDTLSKCRLGDC